MFFVTIVMVTPGGRAVASDCIQQTMALFTAQLPYSDAALVVMGLSALGSLLLLRARPQETPVERWILQVPTPR